ncbi:hypothetical protein B0H67DRAFT_646990 [Lasiosphaeris hirsuta]|uniref:Uncharacterized protein n=1 Tax=Lasiosphaeris hirsuta TaxID=260670 RepID=A0AA40DPT9_9PEZI|nr:hypothetical protein B0H67DRAFT_646990 [Lasiosphaeris hirsuta]
MSSVTPSPRQRPLSPPYSLSPAALRTFALHPLWNAETDSHWRSPEGSENEWVCDVVNRLERLRAFEESIHKAGLLEFRFSFFEIAIFMTGDKDFRMSPKGKHAKSNTSQNVIVAESEALLGYIFPQEIFETEKRLETLRKALPSLTMWFSTVECLQLQFLFLSDLEEVGRLWNQPWNLITLPHKIAAKHKGMRHALQPLSLSDFSEVATIDELMHYKEQGALWKSKCPPWLHPRYIIGEDGNKAVKPNAPKLYHMNIEIEWRMELCLEDHLSHFNKIDPESDSGAIDFDSGFGEFIESMWDVSSRHEFKIIVDEEDIWPMRLATRLHYWLIMLDAISGVDKTHRFVLESDNRVRLVPLPQDPEDAKLDALASHIGGISFSS